MNIGAVITARSTSKRYPRKHLGILGGKPMIVQIIEKLKKINNLDHIILNTTVNNTDDELTRVAMTCGADVVRGPEYNLLERDLYAVDEYKLNAVVTISGDCPFISNECVQLLVDGVRNDKNIDRYDFVGGFASLTSAWGFVPSIVIPKAYWKYAMLMHKYKDKYSYEQYWISGKEEPEIFKTLTIDTSHLLPPEITPMKLSIDWNFERLVFNKIIDWLGYYPETIDDFNKAFGGITKL
jgi:spore coat polysaccharide biosynthesis protein SpsF (cytidylyltransferase family)